jgi:hypothetical protein
MPIPNIDHIEEPARAVSAVCLINLGSYLLNHINPIMGSISLILSITYISVKLYKEVRDLFKDK